MKHLLEYHSFLMEYKTVGPLYHFTMGKTEEEMREFLMKEIKKLSVKDKQELQASFNDIADDLLDED